MAHSFSKSCIVLAFALGLPIASASAAVTIDSSLDAVPSGVGFRTITLPDSDRGNTGFTVGPAVVSFDGVAADEGVVVGAKVNRFAAPVINAAGDLFTGNYFSTGKGVITLAFAKGQRSLALLWGSVDAGNEIRLFDGAFLVGDILGSDLTVAATGNQGYGGSFYTLVNSSLNFDRVTLTSDNISFESALYEVNRSNVPVPEPASIATFACALLCLACWRRPA